MLFGKPLDFAEENEPPENILMIHYVTTTHIFTPPKVIKWSKTLFDCIK